MTKDVVNHHQGLLKNVGTEAEAETKKRRARIGHEGIDKDRQTQPIELMRTQRKLSVDEERARYFL